MAAAKVSVKGGARNSAERRSHTQILNINHRASPFAIISQKRKSVQPVGFSASYARSVHFYLIVSPRVNTYSSKDSTKYLALFVARIFVFFHYTSTIYIYICIYIYMYNRSSAHTTPTISNNSDGRCRSRANRFLSARFLFWLYYLPFGIRDAVYRAALILDKAADSTRIPDASPTLWKAQSRQTFAVCRDVSYANIDPRQLSLIDPLAFVTHDAFLPSRRGAAGTDEDLITGGKFIGIGARRNSDEFDFLADTNANKRRSLSRVSNVTIRIHRDYVGRGRNLSLTHATRNTDNCSLHTKISYTWKKETD